MGLSYDRTKIVLLKRKHYAILILGAPIYDTLLSLGKPKGLSFLLDNAIMLLEVRYMKAIRVTQGKILVEPTVQMTSLGNGLQINNETQSRKDIVTGIVKDGKYKDSMIYFPLYAASPLTYEGNSYYIIDEQDVLAIECDDSTNNK